MRSEYVEFRRQQLGLPPKRKRSPNRTAHLTREDFALIRELAKYRIPLRDIAEKFETSYGQVSRIISYEAKEPAK